MKHPCERIKVVRRVKKQLLIVNNNMHIGGVQHALVNLLRCVHEQYDVTLALFHPAGDLMAEIPVDVKVLPVQSAYRFLGMTRTDARNDWRNRLGRSFYAAVCRLLGRDCAVSLMALGQKELTGYDAVISYLHDAGDRVFYGGCNDFVLRHVTAKKKYAFLHCDFLQSGANTPKNKARYARFCRIAACSEGCRKAFLAACPELADKTMVVQNCQDFAGILEKTKGQEISLPKDCFNLLTVARMGREKGIARAIQALAALRSIRMPYHYYVIGDGRERAEVERLIQQYGLQQRVTLLGEMANPYGYMKAADLLFIPSVSEAAPLVIGEAACLGLPILTTETTSAWDMVDAAGLGWVCENSVTGMTDELERLLQDVSVVAEKKAYIEQLQFANTQAATQFAQMIDEE